MHIGELTQRLREQGAGPLHLTHVLRHWVQGLPMDAGARRPEHFLPLRLREALPAILGHLDALVRVHSEHPAADGSARLLLRLSDGQSIESVLLPREGLCVSTQVGCAVGCRFCMTGQGGLLRQLGSAEIVAQVVLARTRAVVRKVVFMGMGEPAHNLDAVLEAIETLAIYGGIGHKNLVFSTVGDPRVFERLPLGPVRPALALSLHSLDASRRAQLLPRAPAYDPVALLGQACDYAEATGYPLQLQWTLLAGVNDTEAEFDALARLLAGRYAILNLIPYNQGDGLPYARPPIQHVVALARRMSRGGVMTRLRQSAGQDVEGGCGQLRARLAAPSRRSGA